MVSHKIMRITVTFVLLLTYFQVDATLLQRSLTNLELESYDFLHKSTHQIQRRSADEECSANYTVTSKGGNLTSPEFPKRYPQDLDCKWRLASSSSNIILKFSHVDVEDSDDCEYDYIAVYNGQGDLIEKICGTLSNKLVFVNSTVADIVFHTDDSYQGEGFSMEYFLEFASDCQAVLSGLEGTITSPLYPDYYPPNTDCRTTIIVDPGSRINLKFDVLSLEFHQDCIYDYLDIYDGSDTDFPLLGRFCSNPEKASVTSTNNTMLVHFHSDDSMNNEGFSATYTSVSPETDETGGCLWEEGERFGTISSPDYPQKYPSNSHCVIRIAAPDDHVVDVLIKEIKLEAHTNCSYDRIEFRDGIGEDSPLLGYFCGKADEAKSLTSTGNSMYIAFDSDPLFESDGFYVEYQIIKKDQVGLRNVSKPTPPTQVDAHSPEFFTEYPHNSSIVAKESHVMPCKPKNTDSNVEWSKDGEVFKSLPNANLVENGRIFWIHSMSEDLQGTYTCKATDPDGSSHSIHARLEMSEKIENCNIIFRDVPKNATFSENDTTFVRCSVSNSNAVSITWTKDGMPLQTDDHYQLLPNGYLMINKATLKQTGVYTCVAQEEGTECVRKYSIFMQVFPKVNIEEVCGRPAIANTKKDLGKIVGGTTAQRGAHPWQVLLKNSELGAFCGGALLNERWFVTAAHCLHGKEQDINNIVIKLGKYDQYKKEPTTEVVTAIEDYFMHPEFNRKNFDNDIAMVKLLDSISFTDYISPVCLGDPKFVRDSLLDREIAIGTVTGWGRLTERGGRPRYLQEVRLPVVNWETCHQSTTYEVTTNMFCAGYGQEVIGDACKGDSGGPFVMEKDNVWYLVGVVSWGEGCGKLGHYGFYTKVDNYHSWIVSKLD